MNRRVAPFESGTGVPSLCGGARGGLRRSEAAVTLIEMLVAVSLLVVIMAGLFLSYFHVQRAYGLATSQQDVLESGRATLGLLRRDLVEMAPSGVPEVVSAYAQTASANLGRTIQDLYWINKVNDGYTGVGYFVEARGAGVGTLYRFETNGLQDATPDFAGAFFRPAPTNLHRVAEGVVGLQLRVFDEADEPYLLPYRAPDVEVKFHFSSRPVLFLFQHFHNK